MEILELLIALPLVFATLLAVLPNAAWRDQVVRGAAFTVIALSAYAGAVFLSKGEQFFTVALDLHYLKLAGSAAITLFLLYTCRKAKGLETYIPILILIQTGLLFWTEFSGHLPHVEHLLYIDEFSVIMVLVIGVVGGLICLYAVKYMGDWHEKHADSKDRRPMFFATLFLFLSGMFAIVLCNDLTWIFLGWEITTLCSFLLIGYGRDETSTRNAFLALGLNMIGGVAFATGIAYLANMGDNATLALNEVIKMGSGAALIPAVLIGFAGLTKAAQMPFSSWLLGAMVAPTPVSALLHSSTMVKAGVFIIVKFAPVYHGTTQGYLIALVGGITFLMTSLMAVSQRDAKRVLAYSTIANLGLIIVCAGVGTQATVWAAMLLIIFHAVAKALLFLNVGATEHQIGSRDIEDMEGLIVRHPRRGVIMVVGILGMFLAPFGMLISKYATIEALILVNPVLAMLIAFGSAPSLFFWSKWLGKIISMPREAVNPGGILTFDEKVSLGFLTLFTLLASLLFPIIALGTINPYVNRVFEGAVVMDWTVIGTMVAMLAILFFLPFAFFFIPSKSTRVPGYLSGIGVGGGHAAFRGTLGDRKVELRNYYLTTFFDEKKLTTTSVSLCTLVIVIMFTLP